MRLLEIVDLQFEWCRLKSSRVILVLTSYRGFKVIVIVCVRLFPLRVIWRHWARLSILLVQITSWNGSDLVYENLFDSRKGSYGNHPVYTIQFLYHTIINHVPWYIHTGCVRCYIHVYPISKYHSLPQISDLQGGLPV